jgi:hypothetical protein
MCVFCNVWKCVCVNFVMCVYMCGCIGIICTCIYFILYSFVYVYLFLFVLFLLV